MYLHFYNSGKDQSEFYYLDKVIIFVIDDSCELTPKIAIHREGPKPRFLGCEGDNEMNRDKFGCQRVKLIPKLLIFSSHSRLVLRWVQTIYY